MLLAGMDVEYGVREEMLWVVVLYILAGLPFAWTNAKVLYRDYYEKFKLKKKVVLVGKKDKLVGSVYAGVGFLVTLPIWPVTVIEPVINWWRK